MRRSALPRMGRHGRTSMSSLVAIRCASRETIVCNMPPKGDANIVKTPSTIRLLILVATVSFLLFAGRLCAGPLSYSSIDYPGASATFANDINDAGQVVGTYRDASGAAHGFVLQNGIYSPLDFPGSPETFANGINDLGEIVGSIGFASYLYSAGVFTTFNVP